MAKVVFEQATIMGLQLDTVKMRNTGEQRTKLSVLFTDKSMTLHGAQVWGQDKVTEMALKQGKKYNLSCSLQPRQFGGEIIYSLQAYKAEPISEEQSKAEEGADPFNE